MVIVQLTNGFGNNLFQYIAAKMLALYHSKELIVLPPSKDYYGISELHKINIDVVPTAPPAVSMTRVVDLNYHTFFNKEVSILDFFVSGYFENYNYYKNNIPTIKSWFPEIKEKNETDLVLHFRGGDRLLYSNEFDSKPSAQSFANAIEQFDFENLHVVTDMPNWSHVTKEDVESMNFHVHVPEDARVSAQQSADYFNSIVDALAKFSPQLEKRTVAEDFTFIRGFKNILFQHGTLSWWAAILSEADKVGVYGPWRPWKGDSNKKLSNVNIEGWFKWE